MKKEKPLYEKSVSFYGTNMGDYWFSKKDVQKALEKLQRELKEGIVGDEIVLLRYIDNDIIKDLNKQLNEKIDTLFEKIIGNHSPKEQSCVVTDSAPAGNQNQEEKA